MALFRTGILLPLQVRPHRRWITRSVAEKAVKPVEWKARCRSWPDYARGWHSSCQRKSLECGMRNASGTEFLKTSDPQHRSTIRQRRDMKVSGPTAAIIGAIFGMIGALGSAYLSKASAPSDRPAEHPKVETLPTVASGGAHGFGQWVEGLKSNVAYKAETDGFLAAFTGGSNPAKGIELEQ
jgi:hypothetical protein